jgi:glycosyltransferase involved in cell wall biosynthesis
MVNFSVVIPTLNEAKFIERCLLSLYSQHTDESYEIIIADSNSSDGTTRIAEKYADKVILCDKGISLGRNTGAKAAKGKCLVFIDGDSVASHTLISAYADAFKNKNVIAATGPIFPLEKLAEHEDAFMRIGSRLYTESWMKFLIKINRPAFIGSNSAFRKDVFLKNGGFREDLSTFEDGDLSMRLADKGKFMFHEDARVYTSIRRLKKWGYLKFIRFHTTNTFKYMLFKSAHEHYDTIR